MVFVKLFSIYVYKLNFLGYLSSRYYFSDAFLSANCFVKQCRRNRKRAEFCCVRNFNQACCDYLGANTANVSRIATVF